MEDFYKKLSCWKDYKNIQKEEMDKLAQEANRLLE